MNKKFQIIFAFFILLNVGCKKNPFDYRTKYIGDYDFVNSWSYYCMSSTPPSNSGVIYTSGRIEHEKEDMIKVVRDASQPAYYDLFLIDKEGNLSVGGSYKGKCDNKTKMHFSVTGGGLGCPSSSTITGTKRK